MASHPIPLPDTLQSNLQVTLVVIIKTVLLWQCVQLVLSPASDSFKVTERKKKEEGCEMMGRITVSLNYKDTVLQKRTNCRFLLLTKAHSKHLYSHNWGNKFNFGRNKLKQTDEMCLAHSAVGTKVQAAVLMK